MSDDEDDLFASSYSGGDTDDLIADANRKVPPHVATKKNKLQKKSAAPASKKRKVPGE
jgi:hypothetical protein